jgi:hypothetical protein
MGQGYPPTGPSPGANPPIYPSSLPLASGNLLSNILSKSHGFFFSNKRGACLVSSVLMARMVVSTCRNKRVLLGAHVEDGHLDLQKQKRSAWCPRYSLQKQKSPSWCPRCSWMVVSTCRNKRGLLGAHVEDGHRGLQKQKRTACTLGAHCRNKRGLLGVLGAHGEDGRLDL